MTVAGFLEKNLFAILSALVIGLLTYVVGTTNATASIRDIDARVVVMEARVKEARQWHFCATRHIDAMENGGKAAQCELRGE